MVTKICWVYGWHRIGSWEASGNGGECLPGGFPWTLCPLEVGNPDARYNCLMTSSDYFPLNPILPGEKRAFEKKKCLAGDEIQAFQFMNTGWNPFINMKRWIKYTYRASQRKKENAHAKVTRLFFGHGHSKLDAGQKTFWWRFPGKSLIA